MKWAVANLKPGLSGMRPRLGQITDLLTGGLAENVVSAAEPAFRRVVREERTRVAGAVIDGIPFATLSALAFIATRYLVPADSIAKAVGYTTSTAFLAAAAWWVYDGLSEKAPVAPEAPAQPSALDPVAQRAAKAVVDQAEPRLRAILEEERVRIATAVQAGVPFWVGGLAALLATLFLVPEKDTTWKALGYSGSALLAGAGSWLALEKEKETVAA